MNEPHGASVCPVCGSSRTRIAHEKPPAVYVACRACRLLYQDPLPIPEEMRTYADAEYEAGLYTRYVEARDLKIATFRDRLDRLRKLVPSGRLLDVGCASGFMLDVALQAGFDAFGIEFSRAAVEHASPEARPRIRIGDVDSFPLDTMGQFDVVTAFDILEHSHDPIAFLERLTHLLQPRGVLVISTKKVVSLAYLATQIEGLNPVVHRTYAQARRVLPAAVEGRPIGIDIGEMLVLARSRRTEGTQGAPGR